MRKITIEELFAEIREENEAKKEREENLFQKALEMCDIDIQWRYEYLFDLLSELEDKIMELYEEIEIANVDYEIAERLTRDYEIDARQDLINADKRIKELVKEIEKVECKIEATNDIYDEVYANIINNLD